MKNLLIILGTLGIIGSSTFPNFMLSNNYSNTENNRSTASFRQRSSFYLESTTQTTSLSAMIVMLTKISAYVHNNQIKNWSFSNFDEVTWNVNTSQVHHQLDWNLFYINSLVSIINDPTFMQITNYYVNWIPSDNTTATRLVIFMIAHK